jgi:hypothetical protein
MNQLLEKLDPAMQAEVLGIVKASGFSEQDPIFALLLATSTLQVLVLQAPQALRQSYEHCHGQVLSQLKDYEKTAAQGIQNHLSASVKDLIRQANLKTKEPTWKAIVIISAATLAVFAVGCLAGWAWEGRQQAIARSQGKLTLAEEQALDWAMSEEGQYAQNLIHWNDSLQDGSCQVQVKNLGVTLQYGKAIARSGFCFAWVKPPSKRVFQTKR